jgi:polar amino acid transport system substrate-binding protein
MMVDRASGKVSGFSVDLINAVAEQMEPPRDVQIVIHENITAHLQAVQTGGVDLGIAATSFTSGRERTLDFSVPFYQGGLGIVTRAAGRGLHIWDVVTSPRLLYAALWLLLFLVVCAHIIWLTERGRTDTFDDNWLRGVAQAMWWTIVTMTTVGYGDFVPRNPLSRLLGILIIVTGIVLFGMAVGIFSSALTVEQLQTDIRVPNDLRNKPVGVVRNTFSERVLKSRGIQVVRFDNLADVMLASEHGEVVAGVHDVATLRYHVPRNAPTLTLVGPTFAEHSYGIAFPIGSKLRKQVNIAMLELMESNPPRYQWMLDNWFDNP